MDHYQVNPELFSALPSIIQAKILRLAGATVCVQHLELTLVDRIEDAGTFSFIESEVEWLLDVRREILILTEYKNIAYTDNIIPFLSTGIGNMKDAGGHYFSSKDGKVGFRERLLIRGGRHEEDVVKWITGCIDTRCTKSPDVMRRIEHDDNPRLSDDETCMVLLDIRSIFLILKKRFSDIAPERMKDLTRSYTRKTLDRIMKHCKVISFYAYLLTNAEVLELEPCWALYNNIDGQDIYLALIYIIKKESLKLYNMISEAIASMY